MITIQQFEAPREDLTPLEYCTALWQKQKRTDPGLQEQVAIPPRYSLETFGALEKIKPFTRTSTSTTFEGYHRRFSLRDGLMIVEDWVTIVSDDEDEEPFHQWHPIDVYTPVSPVRKIEITYTEGCTSLDLPIVIDRETAAAYYDEHQPNTKLSRPEQIWSRADYLLSVIAMNSTADLSPGCYRKTDIVITWANGHRISIRFDLTAVHSLTQKGPSIARHLLQVTQCGRRAAEWAEALAGLEIAHFWGEPG